MNAFSAPRPWRSPVVVVLLVAPFLGEVLSTSLQPVLLLLPWNLALLAALYGCGALLCREVARRFGLGLPGLILLAAAYGVYEEALIVGTWFDPEYQETVGVGSYGRVWGTSVLLAGHLTVFHVAVSICSTVLIVERLFPAHRGRPWVGRRGLVCAGVALVVVVPLGYGGAYRGPGPQMVAAAAVGVLLVAGAFVVRRRVTPPATRPRRPRPLATVAFLCTGAHFVSVYAVAATGLAWPVGFALAFTPVVVGVLLVRRMAGGSGGDGPAGLRVVVGVLAFFVVLDALVGLGGRYDLSVAALGMAFVLWRLLRRDTAPVFGFVRHPPALVGDLATAVGLPVDDLAAGGGYGTGSVSVTPSRPAAVSGVSVGYAWDMYHERPVSTVEELARRPLERYTVWFTGGRSACEAELLAVYGPAVELGGRHRYGPFSVTGAGGGTGDAAGDAAGGATGGATGGAADGAADGGRFRLEWSATPPDRSTPPNDAAARIAALGPIAARVASASSDADLAAALAEVADGVGITASGAGLSLRPPVPAADLARAFGWKSAVGQTVDVHMSAWVVVTVTGDRTARPTLGRWRVTAALTGRASGSTVPGVHAPAALVAALGADDAVDRVGFAAP